MSSDIRKIITSPGYGMMTAGSAFDALTSFACAAMGGHETNALLAPIAHLPAAFFAVKVILLPLVFATFVRAYFSEWVAATSFRCFGAVMFAVGAGNLAQIAVAYLP